MWTDEGWLYLAAIIDLCSARSSAGVRDAPFLRQHNMRLSHGANALLPEDQPRQKSGRWIFVLSRLGTRGRYELKRCRRGRTAYFHCFKSENSSEPFFVSSNELLYPETFS